MHDPACQCGADLHKSVDQKEPHEPDFADGEVLAVYHRMTRAANVRLLRIQRAIVRAIHAADARPTR